MHLSKTHGGVAINLGLGEARTLVAGRDRGADQILRLLSRGLEQAGHSRAGDTLASEKVPVSDQFRGRRGQR